MPQMINLGSEMLRISPKGVEFSSNGGRIWSIRYMGSACGSFIDLLPYGTELLAVTSKGIYSSTNSGRAWTMRYTGTACGTFHNLMDGGRELLANTDKGLYFSTNSGRSWIILPQQQSVQLLLNQSLYNDLNLQYWSFAYFLWYACTKNAPRLHQSRVLGRQHSANLHHCQQEF